MQYLHNFLFTYAYRPKMNLNPTLNDGSITGTPTLTPLPPSDLGLNGVLPSAAGATAMVTSGPTILMPAPHMTPHEQRRRAALLADSPELSSRPPLNAGWQSSGRQRHTLNNFG